MIPVQEIYIKSKDGRIFKAFVENPSKGVFKWWVFVYDPKANFSGSYSSKSINNNSSDAFVEFVDFVEKYLANQTASDSIEYIDNPCNCELIDQLLQKEIILKKNLSVPVKKNGNES